MQEGAQHEEHHPRSAVDGTQLPSSDPTASASSERVLPASWPFLSKSNSAVLKWAYSLLAAFMDFMAAGIAKQGAEMLSGKSEV